MTPCESYEAARAEADGLNYHFAPTKWHKAHEFDPVIIAAPMLWPYGAKSHAEGLEQNLAEQAEIDAARARNKSEAEEASP